MDRKILGIFLIGVILLTSCAVPAQSMGWKTYYNDEFNWSIKYPSDWIVNEAFAPFLTMFISEDKGRILGVTAIEKTLPLDAWVTRCEDRFKKVFAEYTRIDKKETTFMGERAIEITSNIRRNADSPVKQVNWIFLRKDWKGYKIISLATPSDYDLANREYFEPMIQSFTVHKRTLLDVVREVCPCF